ncbi:MAG: hypothetical protein ACQERB_14365 [Promethearchaeati archaeon]
MKKFGNLIDTDKPFAGNIIKDDILTIKNVKISMINIPKEQEIKPHPEDYAILFFILKGSAIFTTGDGTYKVMKNEAIYLDFNEVRGIKPLEDLRFMGIKILN